MSYGDEEVTTVPGTQEALFSLCLKKNNTKLKLGLSIFLPVKLLELRFSDSN